MKKDQGFNIPETVRRVFLAEDSDGSSIVAREDVLQPSAFPGIGQLFTLWGTDNVIELPDSGNVPSF